MAIHSELPTNLSFRTNKGLSSVKFSAEDIDKIIQGLNRNKTHGHENISIHILKICDDTICKPLEITLSQILTNGLSSSEWKKGNIIPVHEKMMNKT